MSTTYDRLFQSLRLGPFVLANRITMTPMCLGYANEDGTASDLLTGHYREMGASGAALVVTEHTCIDQATGGSKRMLRSDEDRFLPDLGRVAAAIKEGGALAGCQINHLGRYAQTETPLAPSFFASPLCQHSRAMTEEDIHRVIAQFAAAARRVQEAGFDLVELHGGRGYLLMQFLSPYTNRRTDAYGGSLANRMRFPLAVVRAVTEAVDGFPVGYRLTGDEWLPGGFGPEEAATFAAELAKAGVTYLSVMTGSNEAPMLNPDYKKLAAEACYAADASKRIKGTVNIPVIVAGRITTPTLAGEVLSQGQADLIGLARVLLRDPLWPQKARERIEEEIDICDNCSGCTSNLSRSEPVICVRWEKDKRDSRRPGR
ncbi:MAG TPA: NADH:flavin oxidoreductase [Spirochaetia bacterium]|nr:NADH:flavin oxidoreductase [Spirochaetia bacterium]